MKKEETSEFEKLSEKCFGNKYAYRKLMRTGVVVYVDPKTGIRRRMPLTPGQTKEYMNQMIKKLEEPIWAKMKKNLVRYVTTQVSLGLNFFLPKP